MYDEVAYQHISKEFLEEQKNIVQHRPKKSPYPKDTRQKRRLEVYKLHFEYSYSARQIADMMKVNRNTINNDIRVLYSSIHKDISKIDHEDFIQKQILRLESQRNRLRLKLDDGFQSLEIERLLFTIDEKLTNLYIKILYSRDEAIGLAVRTVNNWMEKNKNDSRVFGDFEFRAISKSKRDRINKILCEVN